MSEQVLQLDGRNGQATIYNDKVVISHKGAKAKFLAGPAGDKTIPMSSIQTVSYKPFSFFAVGYIQFGTVGSKSVKNVSDAVENENTIILGNKTASDMGAKVKEYIENQIMNCENIQQSGDAPAGVSVADELAKLRALLDNGTLTQEEFDTQKKKLLGQ